DNVGDQVFESAGDVNDTILSSISFNLATTPEVEHLTLKGTGNLAGRGNAHDNVISGNSGNNLLLGGDGSDGLHGGGGNDILDGGTGAFDLMTGGAGNDVYRVDSAADIATEGAGASGRDRVESSITFDLDTFDGADIEDLTLTGSGHNDGTGNSLANTLIGNGGNNQLSSRDNNDILIGGLGQDGLTGGAGADLFRYRSILESTPAAPDNINEFVRAEGDRIDLRGIDAISGTPANDAFTFIGTAGFSGVAGQLRYEVTALGFARLIQADVNGDGTADFAIASNPVDYLASDFIL
ncbi:MAG TPA: calcium-binding protein, partial [Beijerinckiaceae bacterium]|nr:calcium-binding protein [Beijerinckiaceae bacterium]